MRAEKIINMASVASCRPGVTLVYVRERHVEFVFVCKQLVEMPWKAGSPWALCH